MKKTIVSVAALLAIGMGSASAADLGAKVYKKAPPIVAFDPWDIAFGASIMSNYVFRGITQSNGNKGSVAAYFEPRYNITKDVQLYAGVSAESISFPNRASAEIDGYFGIRPTWGVAAFDFGFWYYGYPGGQCFNTQAFCGNDTSFGAGLPINGNFAKKNASFYEGYAKVNFTINDQFAVGFNDYYSPNFLNLGAWGNYASVTAKYTAPSAYFGSTGIGMYVSGEYGRQWLGTSDAFYGIPGTIYANGIPEPSYNTWNVGVGFTYKVFTLDLRYSDTDLSKGDCNAFTSDFSTTNSSPAYVTNINGGPGAATAFGSSWCGATGIAKLSVDLTAMSNLK